MRLDEELKRIKEMASEIDNMVLYLLELKIMIKELQIPEILQEEKVNA